jgi:hypothetical protein
MTALCYFEKPGDAIPQQSVFKEKVSFLVALNITAATERDRAVACEKFFEFLLRPDFGPFHCRYESWRRQIHAKCDELCMDPGTTDRLIRLCLRFKRLFPVVVDVEDEEDPS